MTISKTIRDGVTHYTRTDKQGTSVVARRKGNLLIMAFTDGDYSAHFWPDQWGGLVRKLPHNGVQNQEQFTQLFGENTKVSKV